VTPQVTPEPSISQSNWRRYVRPQDFVWLLLFLTLAAFSPERGPERHPIIIALFIGLGVVQVLETRIGAIASAVLRLALCYVLIGYSGGVNSSFYLILFLPVISAATSLGLWGASLVSLAACGVYLSFLFFLNENQVISEEGILELVLRSIFLPVVGFLTYQLAGDTKREAQRAQATADELAEANRNLQEARAQVTRADRLAALGQLTAGLAHELRNPLGTMKTSAEMLSRSVERENEIAKELAGFITSEVDRTNSLITRFLDFAKPQPLQLTTGDITVMLDDAIRRFEREQKDRALNITIYKNYSPDVPPISFDAQLLERVIANLLLNAAQASPPGAVVTVKTQLAENGSVEIAVIDRGAGIERKNLENIFNPFFTTKPDGVGFGLAIVAKIVNQHGGQVTVESTPGEGSVFRLFLPLNTPARS
jgi:two-component system sensor histidine kinase HydH